MAEKASSKRPALAARDLSEAPFCSQCVGLSGGHAYMVRKLSEISCRGEVSKRPAVGLASEGILDGRSYHKVLLGPK